MSGVEENEQSQSLGMVFLSEMMKIYNQRVAMVAQLPIYSKMTFRVCNYISVKLGGCGETKSLVIFVNRLDSLLSS